MSSNIESQCLTKRVSIYIRRTRASIGNNCLDPNRIFMVPEH